MVRAPCPPPPPPLLLLLLLLPPLLRLSAATQEPCEIDEIDDDDVRCVCNFTDPEPQWSSALQCMSALEVEVHGGGRSLQKFVGFADTNPKEYVDLVRALRLRRLTVGTAQVPASLLVAVLRGLGSSRLRQLTLKDLEVTGMMPLPPLEDIGPALSTLSLHNVSWATGDAWLAKLQQWLKPGLRELSVAQAHSLAFRCEDLRTFSSLRTLDLSDNPALGERGLAAALCPNKFPVLQELTLRNAGMETTSGVCAALAAAGVQPQRLDLSHNSLRTTTQGAPACTWPSALSILNLSFAGLEQVPQGLPAELSVLDLSCNRLHRVPRPEELPKVTSLTLDGNPFVEPDASKYQEVPTSGVVPASACSALALGMSGTVALLQGAGALA